MWDVQICTCRCSLNENLYTEIKAVGMTEILK